MNNRTVVVLGLCGLASSALAQNFSLTLVPSAQTIDTSAGAVTMTMTVFGDADVGTHMWEGAFAIESDSSNVIDMSWTPALWSAFNVDGGFAGNGNYNEIIFGHLTLGGIFPPFPGSELGMEIGSFEVTLSGTGLVEFELLPGSMFTLEIVDQITGNLFYDTNGTLSLESTQLQLVPSSSVGSVLAVAGLVVIRRRRSTTY